MLRALIFLISALILGTGCGPSGGGSRSGTGDGSGVDPGGDLPSLSPDRFGAALSDAEVDATYQAISTRLDSLHASLPDSRAERAALLASELRQIPNVLFTHISGDHNVTVQLRNGTPYLILTARRPQGGAAPIESSPPSASEAVSPDEPSGLSSSEQALGGSCNRTSPADGDEELPSGDQALLIDVQSLGGEAPAAIKAALENKQYTVTTSLGSLADLRTKVKDIDKVHLQRGDLHNAISYASRSSAVFAEALGAKHATVSLPLLLEGKARLAAGVPAQAIAPLERSLAICEAAAVSPQQKGDVSFTLARALVASGRDRKRALDLARRAKELYREQGKGYEDKLGEVDAWLALARGPSAERAGPR